MKNKVAGVYFYGGKASQFIACVFDYFSPGDRWVLDKLHFSSSGEKNLTGGFDKWAKENQLTDIVVNFPVDSTFCETCSLECPGEDKCHHSGVKQVRDSINSVLSRDLNLEKSKPKEYERSRNKQDEVTPRFRPFSSDQSNKLISKGLKKRLRKGFTPYWNRPIDVFIWLNYYEELSQTFNFSYDSFGHTSLMTIKRFQYLKKHLSGVSVWESNVFVGLLELLREDILGHDDLYGLKFVDEFSVSLRKNIVSKIEKNLNVFLQNEASAILTFDPKAINAFILGLAGVSRVKNEIRELPKWCQEANPSFVVPSYSSD